MVRSGVECGMAVLHVRWEWRCVGFLEYVVQGKWCGKGWNAEWLYYMSWGSGILWEVDIIFGICSTGEMVWSGVECGMAVLHVLGEWHSVGSGYGFGNM
jgi:hypothetical protein